MSTPGLDLSLGPIEFGVLVATLLYGVMIVQCYTYYKADFKDSLAMELLVCAKIHICRFISEMELFSDSIRNVRAISAIDLRIPCSQTMSSLAESFHTFDLWLFLYKITITDFGSFAS